ncbi:MAG: glutamine synthetase family protein [Dehalococcoidia bacterium]
MKDQYIELNPNRLVRFLDKLPRDFTKEDLIKFVGHYDIRIINYRFVGGDGRLKTVNCGINSRDQLDRLLSSGERVDGSSLFSYVDSASSDLYIIPRFQTAFLNPFSVVPALDILCSYYTNEGTPLPSAPEATVKKAHDALKQETGFSMEAMGELEYYVFHDADQLYPVASQKGYHESSPFSKTEALRLEALNAIAQIGGRIKYGHSEVGNIRGKEQEMEQSEIEFLPVPIEDAADQLVLARWALRTVAYKYGVTVSFAPKILVGHAGNGLHIHSLLTKDGSNAMVEGNRLTDTARRKIAGYLSLAPSLTAFGNTVPVSYLRLSPNQEAPTVICWGDQNRSALVRVPLGWLNTNDMVKDANPLEKGDFPDFAQSQTVEFRCPDGSANVHLTLAGLAVAARYGLQRTDALELADKLYVDVHISPTEKKMMKTGLPALPGSCAESADHLSNDRRIYEKDGVFSPVLIDGVISQLRGYNDGDLSQQLYMKGDQIKKLVDEYLHCG